MTYVDLNPIRAAIADTPENSDYTSIQARLGIQPTPLVTQDTASHSETKTLEEVSELQAFAGDEHIHNSNSHLPFHFADYVALVDWPGRQLRDDRRDAISQRLPSILDRLGIVPKQWLRSAGHVEQHFFRAIGPIAKLEKLCEKLNQRWLHGVRACRELYSSAIVS
jgi:putative transposase